MYGTEVQVKKKAIKGFICFALIGLAISVFAATSIEPVSEKPAAKNLIIQEECL